MSFIKRFHKSVLLGIIVVAICSIIVILYPKEISFDKDILDKHIKGNVKEVRITRLRDGATDITKWISNKDDVSKIIHELSKTKMIKCKKPANSNLHHIYNIGIFDGEDLPIGMFIYDGGYINLYINLKTSSKCVDYKILRSSLDMNYIESLF